MHILKYSVLILSAYLFACTSSNENDIDDIKSYLELNNIPAIDTLGVFVQISEAGSEEKPSPSSTIELAYTGRYLDGEIFDQTKDGATTKLSLTSAIPGLQSGLRLFGKNGYGSIYIPSNQAYGANPPFGVRKNAILVFDIEVIDF